MWEHFKDFWSQPWKGAENMTAGDWFLLVGLVFIILMVWGVILHHLKEALEG